MKNKFREFYSASEDKTDTFWGTAIFSFNANILLNLYRYTEDTKDKILSVFEYLRQNNRLWLPYQVGLEYHSNRLQVISAQKKAYGKLTKQLEGKLREIEGLLGDFQKHPYINADNILGKIKSTFDELIEECEGLEEDHPDFEENDPILRSITSIFDGFVGDSPSGEVLKQIYKEGEERYEKKVPPGYRDASKKERKWRSVVIWRHHSMEGVDRPFQRKRPSNYLCDRRFEGRLVGNI